MDRRELLLGELLSAGCATGRSCSARLEGCGTGLRLHHAADVASVTCDCLPLWRSEEKLNEKRFWPLFVADCLLGTDAHGRAGRLLGVMCALGISLFGTLVLAQAPSDQVVIERIALPSPITHISLFGDARMDSIASIREPMVLNFSPGRVEVLIDAQRLFGPQRPGASSPANELVGVPVRSLEKKESASYFRTLSSAGCMHEDVAFYRKLIGGRTTALYAAWALLNQDPMTTTWDNDLDHSVEHITLYALNVEDNEGAGPPFRISFVQVGSPRRIQPTCDPFSSITTAFAMIRDHNELLEYPLN